jgi:hypothetical protein
VRTTTQAATINSPSTRGRERGKVTRRRGVSLDIGERDDAEEIEDVVRLTAAVAAQPPPPLVWWLQGRPYARSAAPCKPPHAVEDNIRFTKHALTRERKGNATP